MNKKLNILIVIFKYRISIENRIMKVTRYTALREKIKSYSDDIDLMNDYIKKTANIHTDIDVVKSISNNPIIKKGFILSSSILKNDPIRTMRYQLFPNDEQIIILQSWFNAYIDMYNFVINIIKTEFRKELAINNKISLSELKIDLTIGKIKKLASAEKEYLQKKFNINMHILDYALVDAVAMFKSKISNIKNGHQYKSKLKYLKKTKKTKIIKIENYLCRNDSFCVSVLGNILNSKPNVNFKEKITMVGIIQYNKNNDKYYLLARQHIIHKSTDIKTTEMNTYNQIINTSDIYSNFIRSIKLDIDVNIKNLNKRINVSKQKTKKRVIRENKNKYKLLISSNMHVIAIDPGIRTMITGISDDHFIEMGTQIYIFLERKMKFIDKINNNTNMKENIKRKIINRTEETIKNKINDYHWKIINYLTSNYKHILIGNFSTKKLGEQNINDMLKRVASRYRFYVFKERLKYKCYLKGIKYQEIDEYCTSKCCSSCGNFKKDLGSSKVYNCTKCGLTIGRDLNASKNIFIKGIKN